MAALCICRLCASSCESYVQVFEPEGEDLHLSEKIKECLQISLTQDDLLPKLVCLSCCAKVSEFFEFLTSCARAQVALNNDLFAPENNLEPQENEKSDVTEGIEIEQSQESKTDTDDNGITKIKDQQKTQDFKADFSSDEDVFNEEPKNKKVFENYIWKCSECPAELGTLHGYKTHYKEVHDRSPVYPCQTCTKVYENYRSFARHVKLHSDTRRYSCKICGKRFSLKTVLRSHSTVHSEERPHVCSQCGKAFKQFSSLYLHSKCHLPDQAKPKFPCRMCDKAFSSKHTMETHMKIHTGERNFICDICGKSFIAKGSLDYHISGHSEMKPHACTVCGKAFKTARLLGKHSTLHTGVKPHQCDVCGKQFRERSALKEHNRIHTGAMPYSCQFCGKAFRFKGILTVHIRQHTGERPYSCKECKRDFTNWANYNKHMKRRHKTVQQKEIPAPVEVVPQPVINDSPPITIEPDSLVVEYGDELFISMPGRYNYHYLNPLLTAPMQNVVLQRAPLEN